jgi:hypothetical protein
MSIYHEIIEALNPLINAFDQIGIFYYIGGSVSSSLQGTKLDLHYLRSWADVLGVRDVLERAIVDAK